MALRSDFNETLDKHPQGESSNQEALVQRMLLGENPDPEDRRRAWEEWWSQYGERIDSYLRWRIEDPALRDEIRQDTLTTAYVQMEKGNYEPQVGIPLTAWVKSIANKRFLKALARTATAEKLFLEIKRDFFQNSSSPERDAEAEEACRVVRAALAGLPERRRQILQLYFEEGLDGDQIAERLGIKHGLVRKEKQRALEELRRSGGIAALGAAE